jgi:diguanylate cyclase
MIIPQEGTRSPLTCLRWILLSVLLLIWFPVSAQAMVQLSEMSARVQLGSQILYFKDPDGIHSLQDLPAPTAENGWRAPDMDIPSFGFDRGAFWFHTELRSSASLENWFFEISNPLLDEVEVFVIDQGRMQASFTTGDRLLFNSRPLDHHNFVFPLAIAPERKLDLYVRVRTTTSLQVPMALWQPQAFERQKQATSFWFWSYFGLMVGIGIYNLFVYLMLRDRSYLYYVLFVASSVFYFSSMRGFVYQYVFPTQPHLNEQALPVTVFAVMMFSALFTISFLRIRKYLPRVSIALQVIAGSAGLLALFSLVLPYSVIALSAAVATLLCATIFLSVGIAMLRQDYAPARYFVLAWVIFLAAIIVFTLSKLGFIPSTLLNDNAPIVGSALEALLLSFGLAARFNLLKERARTAERERLQMVSDSRQKQMNAMRTLIAGVAHQFNTPLGVGLTAMSLMQDESSRLGRNDQVLQEGLSTEQTRKFLHTSLRSSTLALESFGTSLRRKGLS